MAASNSQGVANEAITLMGDNQPLVTAGAPNFDNSPAGEALQELYTPTVLAVARDFGWDFARNTATLGLSGNAAPDPNWTYEYVYPGNGVEVWQLLPSVLVDTNNPLPIRWAVGNNLVNNVQTKVIWSKQQNALANYNNAPQESTWDALFLDTVVRRLAAALSTAIAGKADTAAMFNETSSAVEQVNESRGG